MSDLQNQTPADTYKGLLQVGDYINGVDPNSEYIQDGEGTPSALSISTTKVGVGTVSPSAELDVNGNVVADEYALDQTGSSSSAVAIHAPATNELAIRTNSTEAMRIDSNGQVGIGVASPSYTFHVEKDGASYPTVVVKGVDMTAAGWGSYISAQTDQSGTMRGAVIGSYRPTTGVNHAGILQLASRNSTINYLWCDDASDFRISTNAAHIGSTNGTVIGTQTSDERMKNIESDFDYGLEQVMQLKPIAYTFKDDQDETRRLGFGAQTTQDIIPEAVYDTQECIDGYDVDPEDEDKQIPRSEHTKLAMKYVELVPVLTKAIQEQQTIIDGLKSRIAVLEGGSPEPD